MNDTTTTPNIQASTKETLAKTTNTNEGTNEHSALKEVHRGYNNLNGFQAMIHIIHRFRLVLIPFILLSVAGSSYSFYSDFKKSLPMLSDETLLILAIFFSICLEIVRDGAIISLFNAKMKKISRGLVIIIFVATTSYMFSSHFKAVNLIEESAVKYAKEHQTTESQSVANPRYRIVVSNLTRDEGKLKEAENERKKQLDLSANAKYSSNKINAQNEVVKLDLKIIKLEASVEAYQNEKVSMEEGNIANIENSQKLISDILLATLILVESLAMLGAVIKFIYKDNAEKEIAKHSEIVEEYVNISEQMKRDNEALVKNLGGSIKIQSQANQNIMEMVVGDLEQSSNQNIKFIQSVANLKNEMVSQMNEIVLQVAQSQQISPSSSTQHQELTQTEETMPRKMGFQTHSNDELVKGLYGGGSILGGKKLIPKSKIINPKNRKEDEQIRAVYTQLQVAGAIELKPSKGYYAVEDYSTAKSLLDSPTVSKYDFNLGDF